MVAIYRSNKDLGVNMLPLNEGDDRNVAMVKRRARPGRTQMLF